MPAFITFGRILFAVLFLYTGAAKLLSIQPTADFIATKVTIPVLLAPYTAQLETMTGMSTPQMLAIAVGAFEIISGLMIALNFGTRFFAILLIIFVAAATFYVHDF
jgi:putative oxidoreductase